MAGVLPGEDSALVKATRIVCTTGDGQGFLLWWHVLAKLRVTLTCHPPPPSSSPSQIPSIDHGPVVVHTQAPRIPLPARYNSRLIVSSLSQGPILLPNHHLPRHHSRCRDRQHCDCHDAGSPRPSPRRQLLCGLHVLWSRIPLSRHQS